MYVWCWGGPLFYCHLMLNLECLFSYIMVDSIPSIYYITIPEIFKMAPYSAPPGITNESSQLSLLFWNFGFLNWMLVVYLKKKLSLQAVMECKKNAIISHCAKVWLIFRRLRDRRKCSVLRQLCKYFSQITAHYFRIHHDTFNGYYDHHSENYLKCFFLYFDGIAHLI